jgi:hypothetical protein
MEIEDSNSISELKTIAKSKVFIIQRIHKLNDEKSIKELYIIICYYDNEHFLISHSRTNHNS